MPFTRAFALMAALVLMLSSPAFAIIFVDKDATGGNDGTSWTDAYTDLVSAMNKNTTEEIWVAAGSYDPDGDPDNTYKIDNHPVYGGFGGFETNRVDRNRDVNITILTGALSGGGNASRVVQKTFSGVAVLDGFTITEGFGIIAADDGGGIRVEKGTITIADCIFTNNRSGGQGGAAWFVGDSIVDVVVSNCAFNSNSNTVNANTDGGAIFVGSGVDSFTLVDSSFDGNISIDDGGDLHITTMTGAVIVLDCTFKHSFAVEGAAIARTSAGETTIENCTFNNHKTGAGVDGGVIALQTPNPTTQQQTIRNCTFTDATPAVTGEGGAIYINYGPVTIDACTFANINATHAGLSGGAITIEGNPTESSAVTVTNCNFDNVSAGTGDQGGAIKIGARTGIIKITDCTFTNVTAGYEGTLVSFSTKSNIFENLTLIDCSQTDSGARNGAGISLEQQTASTVTEVRNCTFTDLATAGSAGGGAIYSEEGQITIDNCSFRRVDSTHTSMSGGAIKIDQSTAGLITISNCTFDDIDGGTLSADGGAIVIAGARDDLMTISDCVFTNISIGRRGGAIHSLATNTLIQGCTFSEVSTINNLAESWGGAISLLAPDDSSHTIQNCTFRNTSSAASNDEGGGAIYVDGGKHDILNCNFRDTSCTDSTVAGGAIYVANSTVLNDPVLISHCTFNSTSAGSASDGGAIYTVARKGTITISDSTFTSCTAGDDGGALFLGNGNSTYIRTVERCRFESNTTVSGDGAGITIDEAAPGSRIVNCVFVNNSCSGDGDVGGVWQSDGVVEFIHCTFVTNTAESGGGIYVRDAGDTAITNCIFRDNQATSGAARRQFYAPDSSVVSIDYSDIDQTQSTGLDVIGANMFDTDPLFVNPAGYNFHLKRESPLVDEGLTLSGVLFDRDGNPRPQGESSDIGAFEVIADPDAMIFTIL